jgi:aromatic ring hydroxylase
MPIRTPQQYYEGLRDGRVVYLGGKKIKDVTKDPILRIAADWCGMDYVLMQDPRYQPLLTRKNEKGELESVLFYPTKTIEDLLRRREIIQTGSRICYGKSPSAKFTGIDALNVLTVVSRRTDRRFGTNYTERVEKFRKHLL